MNEPFDVQKTIHDRIVMHSKHGVQGAWSGRVYRGLVGRIVGRGNG